MHDQSLYKSESLFEKIRLQCYYLVLQKSENLKDHPLDYSTGVIIASDNNYNFHRYLDNGWFSFILFAFLAVFYPSEHD